MGLAAAPIAFWGCARGEFLDVWNCARTLEYVRKYLPNRYRYLKGCCPDFSHHPPPQNPDNLTADDYLALPYTNPVEDDAWWYDSSRPESAGFFGFQVLSFEGRFGNHRDVQIDSGVGCSVTNRYQVSNSAQVLTVEAAAYGLSCCSIAYGIRALRHLLGGCGCDDMCHGTQMTVYDCDPHAASHEASSSVCLPPGDSFVLPPETGTPWRLLTNAKLIEMPEVIDQQGGGCGSCGCSNFTTVRFTIATDPGAYLDETVIVPEKIIVEGECLISCDTPCTPDEVLQDPDCPSPMYVAPGDTSTGCFCPPLVRYENCFEFNLGDKFFESELEFNIYAGSKPLRNLEVRIWKKLGDLDFSTGVYDNCNSCSGFTVQYIPNGSSLIRTVCGARVTFSNQSLHAGTALRGPTGGGDACVRLGCGSYIICVYGDASHTADNATIAIHARVWEP